MSAIADTRNWRLTKGRRTERKIQQAQYWRRGFKMFIYRWLTWGWAWPEIVTLVLETLRMVGFTQIDFRGGRWPPSETRLWRVNDKGTLEPNKVAASFLSCLLLLSFEDFINERVGNLYQFSLVITNFMSFLHLLIILMKRFLINIRLTLSHVRKPRVGTSTKVTQYQGPLFRPRSSEAITWKTDNLHPQ